MLPLRELAAPNPGPRPRARALGPDFRERYYAPQEMKGVMKRSGETLANIIILLKNAAKELHMDRPPVNKITLAMFRSEKVRKGAFT